MRPVCNHGLCGKRAAKDSAFCRAHARLKSRAYPEGKRVVFAPSPVSLAIYTVRPPIGARGAVVSVPLPRGRATFLGGPGGGILYVNWDGLGVSGVSPLDCYREAAPRPQCSECGAFYKSRPRPVGCEACNPAFWRR